MEIKNLKVGIKVIPNENALSLTKVQGIIEANKIELTDEEQKFINKHLNEANKSISLIENYNPYFFTNVNNKCYNLISFSTDWVQDQNTKEWFEFLVAYQVVIREKILTNEPDGETVRKAKVMKRSKVI